MKAIKSIEANSANDAGRATERLQYKPTIAVIATTPSASAINRPWAEEDHGFYEPNRALP